MKKHIYRLIFASLLIGSAISCSDLKFGDAFLEKAPGVDVTIDTIFSSKMYAERALVSAYATMRVGYPIHNSAWPLGSQWQFNTDGNYDRGCSQLDNDNFDAITDLMVSHNSWQSGAQLYYAGNYSADSENGLNSWTKMAFIPSTENNWTGIRKAFLYIENVDKVPDMTEEEKMVGKGECYVIIASHYLDMFRNFGGIPLLKSSVAADNVMSYDFSRQTAQETLDYILECLEKAETMLPWTVTPERDGHLTKASAMGLKIRALLFAASPIFNANAPYNPNTPVAKKANATHVNASEIPQMYWFGGYDPARWQAVVDACEDFLAENEANGNPYKLIQAEGTTVEDYRSAWNTCYADRYNGEILIQTGRHYPTFADTYLRCYFGVSDDHGNTGRGYGGGCITLNFVDLFTKTDGTKALYTDWLGGADKVSKIENDPFRDRDPRLYESVMIIGDHFRGRPAEMWIGGLERSSEESNRALTGFCSRKYIWDYNDETFMNRPSNYSYLRLPEIYLTYAEALNETGHKAEAYDWLNKVRERVGLPKMDDALLAQVQTASQYHTYDEPLQGNAKLREEILDERARELYFEENRWYDIVRWKREDIFKKKIYGIKISIADGVRTQDTNNDGLVNEEDDIDAFASTFTYSLPYAENDRYWATHWDTKWYLSAFPTSELNKGYGLVQNPGW
ncbi:MAG: RagB/SusD family nutrient uptake outer membrane protein [Bacteroidales bacterium]|nr:RagB/SusD family nutrient uptake outer membrane protein [Bacteroidales bacterium]